MKKSAAFFQQKEPYTYRWYKPDKKVLGKRMEDQLRFAVCYWHSLVWTGADPFGGETFQRPWHAAAGDAMKQAQQKADVAFDLLRLVRAPFFTFHDLDIAPEGATLRETILNVRRMGEVIAVIREAMKPGRMVRLQGHLGSYVHHDGSIGVLLQVEGDHPDAQVLRDVCMHIAATKPIAARREEVPAEVVEKEKEIARAQIANDPKNAGKPANILDKIAEGKLKTFFAENVLIDQPFVKDATKSVGQLLQSAGLKVVRFVRYKVGEAQ